jgi:hypothetical protein
MPAVRSAVIAVTAIAALWVAGCSSGEPSAVTPERDGAPAVSATDPDTSEATLADAVDPCALLSADDVEAVIGVPFDGVPGGAGARSVCRWENPDTGESVTVEIGGPDTAAGGTLPELTEAGFPEEEIVEGPDGTRIVAGTVEFAADDRYNSVRVASGTDASAEESVAAAVRLIERIRPRIAK